jgi:cold shock CspA family protein
MKGTVIWWRCGNGYGFLRPEDSVLPDLFCHRSALPDGMVNLPVDTRVEFDMVDSDRKPGSKCASNVRVIS